MKKKRFFVLNVVMFILCFFCAYIVQIKANEIVIYLDPGHGGIDGGCVSNDGMYEKDVVLEITFYAKEYLEFNDYKVEMTRTGDYDLSSYNSVNRKREDILKRTNIINDSRCLLCVSIHANAFPSGYESGAQVFYSSNHTKSKVLAETIQETMKSNLKNTDRVALQIRNKYILDNVVMPAVIIEVGFLSNESEAQLLKRDNYKMLVGYSIGEGIVKYVKNDDKQM